MTAPLAWLYAIPYERFLSPLDAVRANLITLGFVSVWRVALMIRVLVVVLNMGGALAFFTVMTVADLIASSLLCCLRLPLIGTMGGVRLSEGDAMLRETAFRVTQGGCFSFPG